MMDFDGDMFRGPILDMCGQEVFEEGCIRMEGCDPVGSMSFVNSEATRDLDPNGVYPAALACHGLRAATQDEQAHLRLCGRPSRQVCDLEIRPIQPDQTF